MLNVKAIIVSKMTRHYTQTLNGRLQNRLKVGTNKPKVNMQSVSELMVSRKDFLKSHVLSWQRKV